VGLSQVFCSEDSDFLHVLAHFMPTDRPLTVLDAGANIGFSSLLFARFIKFHGKVIAVEAHPDSLRMVRANTDNVTHLITRVHGAVVTEALAAQKGHVSIAGPERNFLKFHVDRGQRVTNKDIVEEIPTTTLRRLRVRPLPPCARSLLTRGLSSIPPCDDQTLPHFHLCPCTPGHVIRRF
jgi:FkbM family methyltransferase